MNDVSGRYAHIRVQPWLWWLAGLLFVVLRSVWEFVAPIPPYAFKGTIYIRDVCVLFPAALCWYIAILRNPPGALQWVTSLYSWLLQHAVLTIVLASIVVVVECVAISHWVYGGLANVVDEAGYQFQAKAFALGKLWITPQAPGADFFRLPYVVTYEDRWFSGLFPGFSMVLAAGYLLKIPSLVNPLLSGVLVLVTAWAGYRLFSSRVAVLAACLGFLSPFLLFQGASYFSHILTAIFFTVAAVLLLASPVQPLRFQVLAGIAIGLTLVCRPLSAVLLVIFATGWRCWLLYTSTESAKAIVTGSIVCGLTVMPFIGSLLFYDNSLTGSPWVTPHHVIPPYEAITLGIHTLKNTGINLAGLSVDLLGVPLFSLLPLLWFARSQQVMRLPILVLMAVYILGYGLHPYHGLSYGPRFYFELWPCLMLATASGLYNLPAGLLAKGAQLFIAAVLIVLLGILPARFATIAGKRAFYDIQPLLADVEKPALVFVHGQDMPNQDMPRLVPYMAGFQLNTWRKDDGIIFVRDLGNVRNVSALRDYPAYHAYYLDVERRLLSREPFEL